MISTVFHCGKISDWGWTVRIYRGTRKLLSMRRSRNRARTGATSGSCKLPWHLVKSACR